jgi:hypothetical protein
MRGKPPAIKKRAPPKRGSWSLEGPTLDYFDEPEAPELEPLEPPVELLPPGEVVCGDELLPEEPLGPQSFIAVVPLLPLPLELALPLPLAPELPLPLALEPGLLVSAELPGPQSLLDVPLDGPDIELLVPVLVPDFPLVPPVVLLVCAIAAVPSVSAMIDAAVRRRRFIRCPSFKGGVPFRRKASKDA